MTMADSCKRVSSTGQETVSPRRANDPDKLPSPHPWSVCSPLAAALLVLPRHGVAVLRNGQKGSAGSWHGRLWVTG